MGWNDHSPHADRIEEIMIELEDQGISYPDSYNQAYDKYVEEMKGA